MDGPLAVEFSEGPQVAQIGSRLVGFDKWQVADGTVRPTDINFAEALTMALRASPAKWRESSHFPLSVKFRIGDYWSQC